MALGNVMFPVWFFQGIEEMKVISILNVIAKTIFTVGIFIFVKRQIATYCSFQPLTL